MRIEGVNPFHWVFRCDEAVVHEADFTRSAEVVRRTMNGARPKEWISDRYSAQQRHAEANQTCLAHLSLDVAYGIKASKHDAPLRLKLWFDRIFSLADEITAIAPSTPNAKRRQLERQIDVILQTPTSCMVADELIAKIARARDQLPTFCAIPGKVDPTNNACEGTLRPAVIQRKVTNGYRAMWAAEYEAAVHTLVDTAALKGAAPFHASLQTIAA